MKKLNQFGKVKIAIGLWVLFFFASIVFVAKAQVSPSAQGMGVVSVVNPKGNCTPGQPCLGSPTPLFVISSGGSVVISGSATPTPQPTPALAGLQSQQLTPEWNSSNNLDDIDLAQDGLSLAISPTPGQSQWTYSQAVGAVPTAQATLFPAAGAQVAEATQVAVNGVLDAPTPNATMVAGKDLQLTQVFIQNIAATTTQTPVNAALVGVYPTAQTTALITGQQALTPVWTALVTGQQVITPVVAQATAIGTVYTSVQALNTPAYQNTPLGGYSGNGIFTQNPAAATPGTSYQPLLSSRKALVVTADSRIPTYFAVTSFSPSTSASALCWDFAGVASGLIRVKHIWLGGNATTAVLQECLLSKYSSAPTNGTVVSAPTPAALNSNDPASAALIKPYSTPATPGTLLYNAGALFDAQLDFDAPGVAPTVNGENFVDLLQTTAGEEELVLNSASENVGIVAPAGGMPSGAKLFVRVDYTQE